MASAPAILMPFVAHRAFGWQPALIDESWGLRSIPSGIAYSVCRTLECRHCDLLFCDIRFTPEEMARIYFDYRGDDYARLREKYEPGYYERNSRLNERAEYIDLVEQFLVPYCGANPILLDWGGDTGVNSPFRTSGGDVCVYDISEKSTLPGVRSLALEELSGMSFDLIVCSNLLEHVPFPGDVLGQMRELMVPSTTLYIEVPCERLVLDGKAPFVEKKRHWHEHINFFSQRTLEVLLARYGMEPLSLRCAQVNGPEGPTSIWQVAAKRIHER